jgi:hypothetical protein
MQGAGEIAAMQVPRGFSRDNQQALSHMKLIL